VNSKNPTATQAERRRKIIGSRTKRAADPGPDGDGSGPFHKAAQRQLKTDAIVAAAARLIHERGVAGTSLDDVADALGITKPSVYYYVKNKGELIYLCHARIAQQQALAIDRAAALDGSGAEKIRAFVETYARFAWSPDSGLPRLWQDSSLSAEQRRITNQAYFKQADRLAGIIKAAQRDGSIQAHDAEVVERALVSSVLWIPIWYNSKMARYDQEFLLEQLLDIFFKGLLPR